MLTFLKSEWKFILITILIVAVVGVGYYEYKQAKPVPMQTVSTVNYAEILKAMQLMGVNPTAKEAASVTERIIERTVSGPPNTVFVTSTQAEADKQAQVLAKKDGGDYLIKNPITKPDGSISNNFYSVHADKNKSIDVGASYIGNKMYINAGYTDERLYMIMHKGITTPGYGGTVMWKAILIK